MRDEKDRVAARRLIHTLGSITGFENRVDLVHAALATVRKEEREAERKRTLTIIQQLPTTAGADAFRKRVIEEMYRVAALTEKKEDRSEDEHHCYNKGGAL